MTTDTKIKATRYAWINPESDLAPELSEPYWLDDADAMAGAAGVKLTHEETFACLLDEWNGHPAGSVVLVGCTVEGHDFWVFGEREMEATQ